MNKIYYDTLFPTFVVYSDNDNIVNKKIVDYSRELIYEYKGNPFNCPCISTVNTNGAILELPEFVQIKNSIINTLGAFLEKTKTKKQNLKFSCSWLNLYNEHGYQDLHNHPDSMISGVFYLKSDGNRDLIFQSPYHFFQACRPEYDEQNLENCHNVDYETAVGRCFIFPSHLMHRTLPATSERISLSFNIKYDR